jgi:hypothetical protein
MQSLRPGRWIEAALARNYLRAFVREHRHAQGPLDAALRVDIMALGSLVVHLDREGSTASTCGSSAWRPSGRAF